MPGVAGFNDRSDFLGACRNLLRFLLKFELILLLSLFFCNFGDTSIMLENFTPFPWGKILRLSLGWVDEWYDITCKMTSLNIFVVLWDMFFTFYFMMWIDYSTVA